MAKDFTILENNAMQSIATAAGYMTTPLISSLAAYMMVTNVIVPWWHMVVWMTVMSIVGVLVAFPLKRRFINEDQLPFPEGRACGVVLDALYHGAGRRRSLQGEAARRHRGADGALPVPGSDGLQQLLQFKLLRLDRCSAGKRVAFPRAGRRLLLHARAKLQLWTFQRSCGTDFRTLGLRLTLDAAMLGVGGLMGMRVATSVMIGTVGELHGARADHDRARRYRSADQDRPARPSRSVAREIVNQWSLWWGVTMMVVGSLVALAGKPGDLHQRFKNLRGKKKEKQPGDDVLKHIEVPLWISFVGVPVFSMLGCLRDASVLRGADVARAPLAAADFRADGYLRELDGAHFVDADRLAEQDHAVHHRRDRPDESRVEPDHGRDDRRSRVECRQPALRHQTRLHARRQTAAAGNRPLSSASSPARLPPRRCSSSSFCQPDAAGVRSPATIVSDQFPMPSAMQWKGVADLIARGVSSLPPSAIYSMVGAALVAAFIEIMTIIRRKPFPLSSVSIGLGVILPPDAVSRCGSAAVLLVEWHASIAVGTKGHRSWVEGMEPICAGLITGAALVGIANALVNALVF